MTKVIITKVDKKRWQAAQKFEIEAAHSVMDNQDDWNHWWKKKFDNYRVLKGKKLPAVMEVGCGPHTNLRLILPQIATEDIFLEDPLMQAYLEFRLYGRTLKNKILGQPIASAYIQTLFKEKDSYRVHTTSAPLEELPYRDALVDLLVCINVLDHVFDVDQCMKEMNRVLKKDGILVFGQDLSNEEDFKQYPKAWADVGHPIKVDQKELEKWLKNYKPLFKKVLPRQEGRNPLAHYGTYLLIAQKGGGAAKK